MRLIAFSILFLALAAPAHAEQAPRWQTYRNSQFGFSVDIPTGLFTAEISPDAGGITLSAVSGGGKMQVYGGKNLKGAGPEQLADTLSGSDRVKQVTYRAGGWNWLVLSGYYRNGDANGENVIFYTKLMSNADRSAVSAFEISYPVSEKMSYDRVVAHLEKTLTPPR